MGTETSTTDLLIPPPQAPLYLEDLRYNSLFQAMLLVPNAGSSFHLGVFHKRRREDHACWAWGRNMTSRGGERRSESMQVPTDVLASLSVLVIEFLPYVKWGNGCCHRCQNLPFRYHFFEPIFLKIERELRRHLKPHHMTMMMWWNSQFWHVWCLQCWKKLTQIP